LDGYAYDFRTGSTLVEINPSITHNSLLNVFGGEPIKPDYHKNKTLCAERNGYRCIHVWDWDDASKIVKMLAPKKTVYARNCEVKTPLKDEALMFLKNHHLQGVCRGIEKQYGLYHNGVLVELMVFGKPRYNKNCEWELLRLCTNSEYTVVGGASKLFGCVVPAGFYNVGDLLVYAGGGRYEVALRKTFA
jgi:hypothetical protein